MSAPPGSEEVSEIVTFVRRDAGQKQNPGSLVAAGIGGGKEVGASREELREPGACMREDVRRDGAEENDAGDLCETANEDARRSVVVFEVCVR
jgi:hypothetical protein